MTIAKEICAKHKLSINRSETIATRLAEAIFEEKVANAEAKILSNNENKPSPIPIKNNISENVDEDDENCCSNKPLIKHQRRITPGLSQRNHRREISEPTLLVQNIPHKRELSFSEDLYERGLIQMKRKDDMKNKWDKIKEKKEIEIGRAHV